MKLKYEFIITEIGDDMIAVPTGDGADQFHGTVRLNGDAQTWTELIYPSQIMAHVTHFIRTEGGKDRSMDSFRCRFVAWCWPSLRPIHAIHAKLSYYCGRVPYKLGIKKEKKASAD